MIPEPNKSQNVTDLLILEQVLKSHGWKNQPPRIANRSAKSRQGGGNDVLRLMPQLQTGDQPPICG